MDHLKYRIIYEYEFHRGTSAAETARRINDVYGGGVAKENTEVKTLRIETKMNPKIVVDHELFTTCRLCLEEKGKYQIVPAIQENIKFVFDIEVELNNGLPQLICVDCEKLLSNFVCTKQLFQEKQKRLQKRLLSGMGTSKASGAKQVKPQQCERLSSNSDEEDSAAEQDRVVTDVVSSCGKTTKLIIKKSKKTHNKSWRSSCVKQFGCRLCSEKFKKKDEIESHIRAHGRNITNTCFVRLEKFDDKPNITGSTKFVALSNKKIVRNKKYYYIVYTHKSNHCSDTSEDEEVAPTRKFKRRKLDSESSVDTLLIDENEIKPEETDIKPEDQTQDSASQSIAQRLHVNDGPSGSINALITVCYNNLLKKRDSTSIASKNAADRSQLRHKILSIGSKIINANPINCIGILRYLEYRNLEVDFIMNESNANNYVRIRTKLRCKKEKHDTNSNWKNLQNTSIMEPTSDFFDVLNKALNTETAAEDKIINPPHTVHGILLNANPVSNPKKLPKKSEETSSAGSQQMLRKTLGSENASRGDNTISASFTETVTSSTNGVQDTVADSCETTQNALPRLKLKPVHELLANRDTSQDCHYYSNPFHCYAGPAQPTRTSGPATGAPPMYYNPVNHGQAPSKYINIVPTPIIIQPLAQIGNTMSNGAGETNFIRNLEYIKLDTVEFPNTVTSSPFLYLKNLLQVYNINLVECKTNLTSDFRCLIKFKLCFRQEDGPHVELCLSLFSNVKCFCIKVVNYQGIDIDIQKMTANSQWEILKSFTDEIVPRLVTNARNISLPMHATVQTFLRYLKSIKYV